MKFAHTALTAASSRTLQPSFIVRATPQEQQNNSPQGSKTRSTAVLRRAKATALRGKKQSHRRTGAAVFYVKNGRAKNTLILTSRPSKKPPKKWRFWRFFALQSPLKKYGNIISCLKLFKPLTGHF